jgi:peptidoglycan/LPS O-acetylase OafA/YrhL
VPALDGIRAVAIVAVMLFHTTVPAFGAGYLGVDMFFVLSGYLITTLLVGEYDRTGAVRLRAFYARRALRLYPALILMVLLFLPFGATVAIFVDTRANYVAGSVAALLYVSDIPAALHHLYALQHTWSLAVEEQFYLVWPPILVVFLIRGRTQLAGWFAAVVGVASLVAFAVFTHPGGFGPPSTYFDPLTHGPGGLMAGAALAIWLPTISRPRGGNTLQLAGVGALAVLAVVAWKFTDVRTDPPYVTVTTVGTVLLLAGVLIRPGGVIATVLRWRPLVALGRISYGLYLLHIPTFYLIKAHWHHSQASLIVVQFAVSLLLAIASYWLVEMPFLRLKKRFASPTSVPGAVSAATVRATS